MTSAEPARPSRFVLGAHPLRALVETWLLGLLILLPLALVVERVSPAAVNNAILMTCGACGLWMALRTRVPQRSRRVQVVWELVVAVALSVVMTLGLRQTTRLLGWTAIWERTTLGDLVTLLYLMTGPGYLVARAGVRLLSYWDRVRRRRMLLSLTHAHLVVALLVMAVFVVVITLSAVRGGAGGGEQAAAGGLLVRVADRLYLTAVPLVGIAAVLMGGAALALLPLSAAASYILARQTTRRLQTLADTASQMRAGDYGARVEVVGEDEVAQLQADFNAMAEALEHTMDDLEAQRDAVARLLASRRELLANVSHELRTPVATVRATLESLLEGEGGPAAPGVRHDLEVMAGEILRLQRLIDDLFTLSQAEVSQLSMERVAVDACAVARRMVEALAPLAWSSGRVEVVADLPPSLPPALADVSRLEQVLANLLRNAIRYTPPGGIVAVTAGTENKETVRIDVRDTGEGIPPEELPHIWERFYRGERERAAEYRGAGLGLALVKELVEAMDGTITVESALGQGTCFTLTLPRA